MMCSKLSAVALFLSAIGAINWGLVGAINFDLVVWLAQITNFAYLAKIVYLIIGVAGLFALFDSFTCAFSK